MAMRRVEKIKVQCANPLCGNVKLLYPSQARLYATHYCSNECRYAHRPEAIKGKNNPRYKEKIKVACDFCGKAFEIWPCHDAAYKKHFCKGGKCFSQWCVKNYKGKSNPNFKGGTPEMRMIRRRMAASMRKAIREKKAGRHWEDFVDYGLDDLIKHLKSTVPDGYSWEKDFVNGNNVLHIDHIIPMAVFNFDLPEHHDFKRCFALSNLQLLPAIENARKNAKLSKPFQPSLKLELNTNKPPVNPGKENIKC